MQSRDEHLQWCKDRALEYCDDLDPNQAVMSFLSDMRKHPETKDDPALMMMFQMKLAGRMNTEAEVRKFINGFN